MRREHSSVFCLIWQRINFVAADFLVKAYKIRYTRRYLIDNIKYSVIIYRYGSQRNYKNIRPFYLRSII